MRVQFPALLHLFRLGRAVLNYYSCIDLESSHQNLSEFELNDGALSEQCNLIDCWDRPCFQNNQLRSMLHSLLAGVMLVSVQCLG